MVTADLMSVTDAAERLSVTPTHVRRLVREGKLRSTRTTPRRTFIYVSSLEALINENNDNNQLQPHVAV